MNHARNRTLTVADVGEFGLIRRIRSRLARLRPFPARSNASPLVGIGDDCAVLPAPARGRRLLFTCDPVVEGIHYRPDAPPRQVGWKAMARNLSDIAAMGGVPRWATVSLGLRRGATVQYVSRLYEGLSAAAARFGCQIVGGDTTRVRHEQFVVVTLLGEVERSRAVLRSGARVGDAVVVTGTLGGSQRGRHLRFVPRVTEARWLVRHVPVHAMIDISDGLSNDLQRLIEASRQSIGVEIDAAAVPIAAAARHRLDAALNDGEDFDLLFAIDSRRWAALRRQWARTFALRLTRIGRVTADGGRILLRASGGEATVVRPGGYDHFVGRNSGSASRRGP